MTYPLSTHKFGTFTFFIKQYDKNKARGETQKLLNLSHPSLPKRGDFFKFNLSKKLMDDIYYLIVPSTLFVVIFSSSF